MGGEQIDSIKLRSRNYLEPLTTDLPDAVYQLNADAELLAVSTENAGPDYVLTLVPVNSLVYVGAVENGFGKITYEDLTGWIRMDQLNLLGDSTIIDTQQYPKPAESVTRTWKMNQLKEEHGAAGELGKSSNTPDPVPTAFGIPDWDRASITAIYVKDSLDGMPDNAVDISAAQDGGVMGWIDASGALVIAGQGGVKAPENSSALFAYYVNATVIDLGGNLHTDYSTDLQYLFYHCESAQLINISGMNTSMATTFAKMFTSCSQVQALDFASFDTTQVQSFYYMFQNCETIRLLDLTSFTTINATEFSGMFRGCTNLVQVILDPVKFDTSKAEKMSSMFMDCSSLQTVNCEHFNMNNVQSTNNMFSGCSSLTGVGELHWSLPLITGEEDANAYGMFNGCPLAELYTADGEAFLPVTE